jgi:hypothetical protein
MLASCGEPKTLSLSLSLHFCGDWDKLLNLVFSREIQEKELLSCWWVN